MPDEIADRHLKNALIKAYAARASLFHRGVNRANMRALFSAIDGLDPAGYEWDPPNLHITDESFAAIRNERIEVHKVFAHPVILRENPRLISYYRNLVAVSQKGMSQLGYPTSRFERDDPMPMAEDTALGLSRTLNSIISRVIESDVPFKISPGRDVVFAEMGTELQGTWAQPHFDPVR